MIRIVPAVLAALITLPGALSAQAWDAPSFQPPGSERGVGFYALALGPGDDVAALVTWRRPGADLDVGLRGGAGQLAGEAALFGGVELESGLVSAGGGSPLSVAWTGGIGVGAIPDLDRARVRIPFGLTLGRELETEGPAILPYAHPRLAVDMLLRDDPPAGPGDETELDFDMGLGADVVFDEGWRLRFAATLGRTEAVGFGVAF